MCAIFFFLDEVRLNNLILDIYIFICYTLITKEIKNS
nr:MAG TPA: hypothetical protein [Bacteriophage sp.]